MEAGTSPVARWTAASADVAEPEHAARPLDSTSWRRLMSHWATGVSVVTSLGPEGPRGCTVNALTSVSLEPLLLLICFRRRRRCKPRSTRAASA